jgi:hypothetical protein
VAAGLAWAGLLLVRPLDAVLLGAVAGVLALAGGVPRWRPRSVVSGLAASAMGAAGLLWYNARQTGRALYTPQMMWTDRRWGVGLDRLGFGNDIGIPEWRQIDPVPGHGLLDVVLNLNKNLFMTQSELHGWAMGSLWLAAVLLATRLRPRDAAAAGLVAAFAAGYSAYWFSGGPDLGPRYWYPAIVAMALLTVRGALVLVERWRAVDARSGARMVAALGTATVLATLVALPWRASVRHYRYRDVTGEFRRLAAAPALRGTLVFVRGELRADYQAAFNFNEVPLGRSPAPVFAWDRGEASRERVRRAFPGRPVRFVGRSPDGRFRVLDDQVPTTPSGRALEEADRGIDVREVGQHPR